METSRTSFYELPERERLEKGFVAKVLSFLIRYLTKLKTWRIIEHKLTYKSRQAVLIICDLVDFIPKDAYTTENLAITSLYPSVWLLLMLRLKACIHGFKTINCKKIGLT